MATKRKVIRTKVKPLEHAEAKSNLSGKGLPAKWTKLNIGGNQKKKIKLIKVKKVFVLDTNVLIDDPQAIHNFDDNYVVIPITVVDELDNNKKRLGGVGVSVRKALKILEESDAGHEFKKLPNDGQIKIEMYTENKTPFNDNDGLIISVAEKYLKEHKHLGAVVFVTNDRGAALKARALGINTESYKTNEVNLLEFEKIVKAMPLGHVDTKLVYDNGYVSPYVPEYWKNRSVKKNFAQEKAISNLFNPEKFFVSLIGQAGTGKTMMAILTGIKMQKEGIYKQIIITKPPVVADGNDIGFLPGTKDEKMKNWLGSFIDPINAFYEKTLSSGAKTHKRVEKSRTAIPESIEQTSFDKLLNDGVIKIETGAFIRGSNFENTLVIIDEAQNLSSSVGKTWMTRIGSGSKLVLTGDVTQIDTPYLSSNNNALAYMSVKTHGQTWASTTFLDLGVRSIMSDWAANNL